MSRRMKKALVKKMEELEVTKKARIQIERYKRQYKIMEGSRLAYNEELSVQLDKQKGHLGQLEFDKVNLDTEENLLSSASIKLRKVKLQNRIHSLLKQKNTFEEEVKYARLSLLDISSQIMRIESDLDQQRLKRIDRQAKMEAFKNRESKISYFESQLSMETVELNKLITKNRHMREEMESLLRERARFKELLDKLHTRLADGRILIHHLMEQGTIAFEHREEAQSKVELLRRKMMSLREKHGQGMRDLDRELEDNVTSAAFLMTKGQERGGKAARVEEEEAKKLVVQDEVHKLDQVYKEITLFFPGLQDSAAMADQYLIQEDENFAIFNYVNEVNCEVESIQAAGEEMKANLAVEEEKKREKVKQRRSELCQLSNQLEGLRRDMDELARRRKSAVEERQLVVTSCIEIYRNLQSTPSPFEALIDGGKGTANPEHCLKLLEKKIRDSLKEMRRDLPPEPRFSIKMKKDIISKKS